MKIVIYIDTAESWKTKAAAVTAYSVQKNGNLPADTIYILYTPEYEKALKQKVVNVVFDRVEPPPLGGIFENLPPWQKHVNIKYNRDCWTKFICFLNTPTNGGAVIMLDWDVLCSGDINDLVPPPGKLISARMGQTWDKKEAPGANGGVLCKTEGFDDDPDRHLFTQPLTNGTAYTQAKRTWGYADEMGLAWYMIKRGKERVNRLELKFNYPAFWHVKSGRNVAQNDTRLIHFMGRSKPWKNRNKRLFWLHWRYDRIAAELEELVKKRYESQV